MRPIVTSMKYACGLSIFFVISFLIYQLNHIPSSKEIISFSVDKNVLKKAAGSFICDDIDIIRFPESSSTPSNESFDSFRRSTLGYREFRIIIIFQLHLTLIYQ